jgi:ATP synthase protein I
MEDKKFFRDIERSAKELKKGRKERSAFWYYASLVGAGGWLFVIPVVGGAYLGRYLDKKMGSGILWTAALIVVGIAIGIYNIWHFYFRKSKE